MPIKACTKMLLMAKWGSVVQPWNIIAPIYFTLKYQCARSPKNLKSFGTLMHFNRDDHM